MAAEAQRSSRYRERMVAVHLYIHAKERSDFDRKEDRCVTLAAAEVLEPAVQSRQQVEPLPKMPSVVSADEEKERKWQ